MIVDRLARALDTVWARVPGGRLTRDGAIYGIGGSATQVVYALFVPILTRIFRPADFGVLESLVALNSLLGVAALLGLNSGIFYFLNRTEDVGRRRVVAGTALILGTSAGLAIALAGAWASGSLSQALLGRPGYGTALAMACAWVPANVAATLALDLLRTQFRPVAYSIVGLGRGAIASGVGVVLAGPLGLGVAGLLAAQVVTTVAAAIVALFLARDAWRPAIDRPTARAMLGFGLPLASFGIALWVIAFSDRFFVIQFLGIAQAGIYALASRGAGVLSLVLYAFEAAWLPLAMAQAGERGHRETYARTFLAVGVGMIGLATVLSLFAREALFVLATPEYLSASRYVGLLCLAVAVYALGQVVGIGIQLGKRTRVLIAVSALGAVTNVGLNVLLIPRLGIPGAALATLLAYVVSTTLVFITAQRAYPVPYPVRSVVVAGLTGVAAMAIGLALDAGVPAATWRPETTALKAITAIVAAVVLWAIARGSIGRAPHLAAERLARP